MCSCCICCFFGWRTLVLKARGNEQEMWRCRARLKTTFDKCMCVRFAALHERSVLLAGVSVAMHCPPSSSQCTHYTARVCARPILFCGLTFSKLRELPRWARTPRRQTPHPSHTHTHTLPRERNYNYQLTHHNYSRE